MNIRVISSLFLFMTVFSSFEGAAYSSDGAQKSSKMHHSGEKNHAQNNPQKNGGKGQNASLTTSPSVREGQTNTADIVIEFAKGYKINPADWKNRPIITVTFSSDASFSDSKGFKQTSLPGEVKLTIRKGTLPSNMGTCKVVWPGYEAFATVKENTKKIILDSENVMDNLIAKVTVQP